MSHFVVEVDFPVDPSQYPVNRDVTTQYSVKAQGQIIAELDSSLFAWLDSVPEHLRWDPQRADDVFFEQSCVLYSYYYFAQVRRVFGFKATAANISHL